MNTVGKAGKLGEHVRCVVSVSMLTEGWDANTVTHILGVRAFGTQLLCEQVVGRGLRRMSYAVNEDGHVRAGVRRGLRRAVLVHSEFRLDREPEAGSDCHTRPGAGGAHRLRNHFPAPRRLPIRDPAERLRATSLTTRDWRSRPPIFRRGPRIAPIVGEASIHTLDDLKRQRDNEVAFLLAKLTLEKYFRQDGEKKTAESRPHRFDAEVQGWLFPQLLAIARRGSTNA